MNMNETRKQIIELIEPYMDKTLSEGCLTYGKIYDEDSNKGNRYYHKEGRDYKILGHYDITAVLKYIENKLKDITWQEFNQKEISFVGNFKENEDGFECYIIPNKPLHLYTEQEELELLNLLTKLK